MTLPAQKGSISHHDRGFPITSWNWHVIRTEIIRERGPNQHLFKVRSPGKGNLWFQSRFLQYSQGGTSIECALPKLNRCRYLHTQPVSTLAFEFANRLEDLSANLKSSRLFYFGQHRTRRRQAQRVYATKSQLLREAFSMQAATASLLIDRQGRPQSSALKSIKV